MLKSSDAFDNSEANWESSGAGTAVPEDSDLLLQLLNNGTFTSEMSHGLPREMPSMYWPETDVVSSFFSSNDGNSSLYCWDHSGGGGGSSQLVLSHLDLENYYLSDPSTNDGPTSKNLCLEDETYEAEELPIDDRRCIVEEDEGRKLPRTAKRKPTKLEANENLKKKASKTKDVENDEDNSQTKQTRKKNKRGDESREQSNIANKQISSENFSSEEESCESQETNLNGGNDDDNSSTKGSSKRKAQRGTATDPQSLYARKRRQRINERLRILQNLVPNGTKVDISTMLEEAVQYVKFLQLQIRLLSSDDLWMYAPLAYNGMSIGLDLKISLPQ